MDIRPTGTPPATVPATPPICNAPLFDLVSVIFNLLFTFLVNDKSLIVEAIHDLSYRQILRSIPPKNLTTWLAISISRAQPKIRLAHLLPHAWLVFRSALERSKNYANRKHFIPPTKSACPGRGW